MSGLLVTSLCLVAVIGTIAGTTVTIDTNSTDCGKIFDVATTSPFVVRGYGNGITSCRVTLNSEVRDGCQGLCYNITNATFAVGNTVTGINSLTIASDQDTRTFKHDNPYTGNVCTNARILTLSVTGNTNGTDAAPAFDFELELYNNCNHTFNGFYNAERFQADGSSAYFKGLAMGLGLSFIWLLLLFSGFMYLKCRPNAAKRYIDSRYVVEEKLPLTEENGNGVHLELDAVEA